MAKIYPLTAIAVLFLLVITSCNKNREAQKPVYLSIPDMSLETEYLSEGTSSSKITTVWVVANGEAVGVFEMPCTVPALLKQGNNDITLYPGINLNGIAATRAIYEGFEPIKFNLDFQPSGKADADTLLISKPNRTTRYTDRVTVKILEDFDGPGLNLQKINGSDTNARKTGESSEVFVNLQDTAEDNGKAGVLYVSKSKDFAQVATTESYSLPVGGANVYLEMNYKCNLPFVIGVIADIPGQVVQRATIVLTPKQEWNKIYVNLVTEVSAQTNASGYKIFFQVDHSDALDTGKVYLDNLKLVY